MPSSTLKLHAYIAQCGITSRRKAEELIQLMKVRVNGEVAHVGQRINPQKDTIEVDGETLTPQAEKKYFLIYKPVGYVSTVNDEQSRKIVTNLVPTTARIYPVGRLDKESEGLMLLTNDGELAQKLTHPKFGIEKTYHVLLKGIPSTPALKMLSSGIKLTDGWVHALDYRILRHEEQQRTWLEITVAEGKKHLIRRMIRRMGYEVLRLVRVKMGPFEIGNLQSGKYVELSSTEVQAKLQQASW